MTIFGKRKFLTSEVRAGQVLPHGVSLGNPTKTVLKKHHTLLEFLELKDSGQNVPYALYCKN